MHMSIHILKIISKIIFKSIKLISSIRIWNISLIAMSSYKKYTVYYWKEKNEIYWAIMSILLLIYGTSTKIWVAFICSYTTPYETLK